MMAGDTELENYCAYLEKKLHDVEEQRDLLQEKVEKYGGALKMISKNTYGTEPCNTDEENNEILARHFVYHQNIAREALEG